MKNLALSLRIKERLGSGTGRNQAGLARACKIAPASVSAWVNGRVQSIDGKHLTTAAAYLGVNPHWLSTGKCEVLVGQTLSTPELEPHLIGGLDKMLSDIKDDRQRQILGAQCVMILSGNISFTQMLDMHLASQMNKTAL